MNRIARTIVAMLLLPAVSAGYYFEDITVTPTSPDAGTDFLVQADYVYLWSGDVFELATCEVHGDTLKVRAEGHMDGLYGISLYYPVAFTCEFNVPAGEYVVFASCLYTDYNGTQDYSTIATSIVVEQGTPVETPSWSSIRCLFE